MGPNNEPVAIKKELAWKKATRSVLEYEYDVYKALAGHNTIPDVKVYGRHEHFNVLVMDLLGPSLGDQFRDCDKRFSMRTTARLGLGMVSPLLLLLFERFLTIVPSSTPSNTSIHAASSTATSNQKISCSDAVPHHTLYTRSISDLHGGGGTQDPTPMRHPRL
jgi:hypothetical protein